MCSRDDSHGMAGAPRGRRSICICLALLLGVALWSAHPGSAWAQTSPRRVNVMVFEPSSSPLGIVTLDVSDTLKHLYWYAGLYLSYSHTPLRQTAGGGTAFRYVRHHLQMDVAAAIGFWRYLELAVSLPATLYQTGDAPDPAAGVTDHLRAHALGDLRIVPKVRFWHRQGRGFGMALVPQFTVPTGFDDAHAGERTLTFEPRLVLDYQFEQGTVLSANLGFRIRRRVDVDNLTVGHELLWGVGTAVNIHRRRLFLLGEVIGAVGVQDRDGGPDIEELPLEALVGIRYRAKVGVIATAGVSVGITHGWGTPDARVFVGLGYTWGDAARPFPWPGDPDGDGISGMDDECPLVAEDRDGNKDTDGCPDPDDDNDGVCDDNPTIQKNLRRFRNTCIGRDQCPGQKEVINGVNDEDGCPDAGKPVIKIVGDKIIILDKIYFATGKARIMPKSRRLLRVLAAVLRTRSDISRLEVAGHTDERGTSAANYRLSRRRARAVRYYLINRGIRPSRLKAKGYGDSEPVARRCNRRRSRAARKACWAKNRRVVLRVLSR